jgi:hypothetical protein
MSPDGGSLNNELAIAEVQAYRLSLITYEHKRAAVIKNRLPPSLLGATEQQLHSRIDMARQAGKAEVVEVVRQARLAPGVVPGHAQGPVAALEHQGVGSGVNVALHVGLEKMTMRSASSM